MNNEQSDRRSALPNRDLGGNGESRKTVTVLFTDATGFTSIGEQIDAEALRSAMRRYFAEIKSVIEHHGGVVEKFIGDAVMAVFGVPRAHEDDALRAVRAADEIRLRIAGINRRMIEQGGVAISFRTGLFTGEAVAGDSAGGQMIVTGDAVNTAARLEQAAEPDEILLGLPTYQLVRDAVTVEDREPIDAKGKAAPVPVYRLIGVRPGREGRSRRLNTPLLGRERELERLGEIFATTVAERVPHLVTVLGAAGIGKSRLIAEFVDSIETRARVVKGRCLRHGAYARIDLAKTLAPRLPWRVSSQHGGIE